MPKSTWLFSGPFMLVILVAADDHGLPYEPNTCEGKIQPKLRRSYPNCGVIVVNPL